MNSRNRRLRNYIDTIKADCNGLIDINKDEDRVCKQIIGKIELLINKDKIAIKDYIETLKVRRKLTKTGSGFVIYTQTISKLKDILKKD